MKKPIILLSLALASFAVKAQISETRELPTFNSITLEGSQDLILSQGPQKVEVKSENGSSENVITRVDNNTMFCSSGGRADNIKIYVSTPELNGISLKGAGDIYSTDTLITNNINISLQGAGDITLTLKSVNTEAELKGSGDINLKGVSNNFSALIDGAGDINAKNLKTQNAAATIKGSGDISLCSFDELNATVDGSGNINYYCNPQVVNKTVIGSGEILSKTKKGGESDTTKVKFKNFDLVIIDKEDEEDSFNFLDSLDLDDENEKHQTHLSLKYGFNGYLNKNNSLNLSANDRLYELDYARSEVFGIHIMQDLDVIENHFKVQTGFGIDINNYMFRHNAIMLGAKDSTYMLENTALNLQKSKLRTINLQIPLELVWKIKEFNVGIGVVGGYNIGSMTKVKYNQNGRTRKDKDRGNYNVNPLSAAATLKLGTETLALFGSYNLTPLFQSTKAPELYPFSIGIVLGGF